MEIVGDEKWKQRKSLLSITKNSITGNWNKKSLRLKIDIKFI